MTESTESTESGRSAETVPSGPRSAEAVSAAPGSEGAEPAGPERAARTRRAGPWGRVAAGTGPGPGCAAARLQVSAGSGPGGPSGSAGFRASGGYRDAFASAEYRALVSAFVVSMLGGVVAGLALTVLVYRRTSSPLLSSLTFAMTFLPYALGGTLLSGLVDRVPPRRLLVGCDLGCAALVAVMALPGLPVPALLALLFAMSLLSPLSAGTRSALLPELLPAAAVVPGRSLLRMVAQAAQIAGYAAGGGLLAGLPPRGVLGIEATAFTTSALVLRLFLRSRPARSPVRRADPAQDAPAPDAVGDGQVARGTVCPAGAGTPDPDPPPRPGLGPGSDVSPRPGAGASAPATGGAEPSPGRPAGGVGPRRGPSLARDSLRGVREVLRIRPLRRVLLLGWLVPFLVVAPEGLAAPAVAERGLPPSATGWWMMALPLGMVAGELAGIRIVPAARRGRLVAPLAACGFVPLLGFLPGPSLTAALALLTACGLCGAYLLGVDQLLLETSPPELLGRVFTVQSAVLMTVQGLGFAGAGALAEVLPPDLVIALAGAAGLVCVALLGRPGGVAGLMRGRGRGAGRGRPRAGT